MEKEKKLVKDKGCLHCNKMIECDGKPAGTLCNQFEERIKDKG